MAGGGPSVTSNGPCDDAPNVARPAATAAARLYGTLVDDAGSAAGDRGDEAAAASQTGGRRAHRRVDVRQIQHVRLLLFPGADMTQVHKKSQCE